MNREIHQIREKFSSSVFVYFAVIPVFLASRARLTRFSQERLDGFVHRGEETL
jgi:hypothetical protein